MRSQRNATLEPEEQVLADRLDRFENAAVDALGDALGLGARMRRLGRDPFADKRLQTACGQMKRVSLGHGSTLTRRLSAVTRARGAAAGAVATLVWAAVEPFDRRLFHHDYSDVAVLGKGVTRSCAWPAAGLALHIANGALFGLAYAQVSRRRHVSAVRLALIEHTVLFPLGAVVDRKHPARGEPGLARLFSWPALAQATLRHAVFGAVLGRLAR